MCVYIIYCRERETFTLEQLIIAVTVKFGDGGLEDFVPGFYIVSFVVSATMMGVGFTRAMKREQCIDKDILWGMVWASNWISPPRINGSNSDPFKDMGHKPNTHFVITSPPIQSIIQRREFLQKCSRFVFGVFQIKIYLEFRYITVGLIQSNRSL